LFFGRGVSIPTLTKVCLGTGGTTEAAVNMIERMKKWIKSEKSSFFLYNHENKETTWEKA
jgi:hypothetical protein